MQNTSPSVDQKKVDCVASFVEACQELEREPFFGKDEKLTFRGAGNKFTFILGDRFHFRSALISFRRIWMPNEPSHWRNVLNILYSSNLPQGHASFAKHHEQQIEHILSRSKHLLNVTTPTDRIVDLWLNTVFAHGGIQGKNKRSDFEAAIDQHGHAAFEFSFRSLVREIGFEFLNIAKLAAQPALDCYAEQLGMKPSFRVGAAFGIRRREISKEGHVVIRQGSSEFFTEETFEERFNRVLERQSNSELKFILKALDATTHEMLRAVLRSTSFVNFLTLLGGNLEVGPIDRDKVKPSETFKASGGIRIGFHKSSRVNVYEDCEVKTDDEGVICLNDALKRFREQLLND